jgi:hypothetical protein
VKALTHAAGESMHLNAADLAVRLELPLGVLAVGNPRFTRTESLDWHRFPGARGWE